ncbi:MAG: alpha/beta fold hydrolase [Oscillospiraceae bacterium]|nr:alpha/beta fold hydrolase [Oscillospiraceae bacterium]
MRTKKTIVFIMSVLLLLLAVSSCTKGANESGNGANNQSEGEHGAIVIEWENHDLRAEQFVLALSNGDYSVAAEGFDADMNKALGVRGLRNAWEGMVKDAGEIIDFSSTEKVPHDEYDIYNVISIHENTGIVTRIVFSQDGLVAGLFFNFTDIPETSDTESVQNDGFTEIPVIIGENTEYPLKGVMTLPDDVTDKIPAVVLVHGSGASDMNGVPAALPGYPNAPFKEIAEYLSLNGIAVIRYDKRTLTHGAAMMQQLGGGLTVWEETIEDAISATRILKSDPRIDENRVYILGHSLGGSLAPRIHASGGDYAGLILFAGTPRSLIEVIADQQLLFALETMEGKELEETIALFESGIVEEQEAAILNMPDDEAKAEVDASGVSMYYFKDLLQNPTEDYIKDITAPFLVMQAENDMQVFADKDFAMYQELLSGRDNVVFMLYEGLNHFFMPSAITSITDIFDEYKIKASVDEQVLRDIAEWVNMN